MNTFFTTMIFLISATAGKNLANNTSIKRECNYVTHVHNDSIPQTKNVTEEKNSKQTEDLIVQKISSISEVKAKNYYIDSITNHKSGITIIIVERPSSKKNYYWVQAGYNNEFRFEPYYNFYVYPPTLVIKFYDTINDKILSIEEWRKSEKQ